MANNNLPPLRRDDSLNVDNSNIFHNTAVIHAGFDDGAKHKNYASRSKMSDTFLNNKISNSIIPIDTKLRNNNFFKSNSEDLSYDMSSQEITNRKLVPIGYFDQSPGTISSVSQAHTSTRYNENIVSNSIEFPKLNRTIHSETLYSLKSQDNKSPHDRIMRSLEKQKKK